MLVGINYGRDHLDVEVSENKLVQAHRQKSSPALADPAEAVALALEAPRGFPPLRRALTPDDHVGIVIDDRLPRLADLLVPVIDVVIRAGVRLEAITVLHSKGISTATWQSQLPEHFQKIAFEMHDPSDRKRLSYLAATRHGRRIYLNRTLVDADQLVVLSGRDYDPLLGYSGCEGALYPAFSNEETQHEMASRLSAAAPGGEPWPVRREAAEVAWLLGAPFMVQIIPGKEDDVLHVIGGLVDTSAEGDRLLDAQWRVGVESLADTVVASIAGDPNRHQFSDLARALACGARVTKPQGRIVLLTQAKPALARGAELLMQAEDPEKALMLLQKEAPADMAAGFQWAHAAKQATIYLLSDLPAEIVEDLFAVPLEQPRQVERLISGKGSCLFLPDAHKTMAVADV